LGVFALCCVLQYMTPEERTWLLISRAVSGDITPEELHDLECVFLTQPELREDYENIIRLKLNTPSSFSLDERRALERGLEKLNNTLSDEPNFIERDLFTYHELKPLKQKNSYIKWISVAASIIAVLFVGVYALRKTTAVNTSHQEVLATHFGTRMHHTLPDGSTVWLNAGSSIKYADNLIVNGKREVTLSGEAYFDVKHDAQHPFIVHAGKLNVVVLGTSFNVKAYTTDRFIETTLINGKVEILNDAKPGTRIVMYPNEKVRVDTIANIAKKIMLTNKQIVRDSVSLSTSSETVKPLVPDESIDETAWVSNKLTFKKENFSDLATQLERWYAVGITFDNDKYLNKQFTGTFKDQDINEVMSALQLTQSFHYSITNNQIHIW